MFLRKRDPPKSLGTQYQVQNESEIRKNQKVVQNNGILEVKTSPKNEQRKFQTTNCPTCKQNNWLEFDKGYYCRNCEYIINKQKNQIAIKVLRQDHNFSTRQPYANKKIEEMWMNMVNTTYN